MSAAVSLAPGLLLEGKYKIVRLIGEGAWGEVFEGVNVRIQRRIAIKVLKTEYASNEAMVSRFEREALASTHIESPHVVQVYDAGVLADGRPYLVMEFLTGQDIGRLIENAGGRLPILNAVDLCAQAARGLAAAHAANVFHRDMKPTNIMVAKTKSGSEIAKLVDFGISKLLDASKEPVSKTQTGTVLGSPVYMSPEQARGSKSTDHRSDIYSLGVVLYECLAGQTPHMADGFNELLFKIVLEEVPSIRTHRPEIDEELDAILRHTLAKVPEQRVQTAAELESLLVDWLVKQGAKVGDSRLDSATLPFSVRTREIPDLSLSPLVETDRAGSSGSMPRALPSSPAELNVTVPVGRAYVNTPTSASPLVTPLVSDDAAAGVAETIPVPELASTGGALSSLGAANTAATVRPAPRWGYPAAGVAVLAILGFAGLKAVTGSPAADVAPRTVASGSFEPSASSKALAEATTTAPHLARAASDAAVPAASETAALATAAVERPSPDATGRPALLARPPVGAALRPRASASAVASAAPSTTAAPSAPSATSPTSVGGRTIRTDL